VRRSLLAADTVALTLALLAALGSGGVIWLTSLPLWILTARALGLYGRDEERTGYSTVDDIVGVLQLVTAGVWMMIAGTALTGAAALDPQSLVVFWAVAISAIPVFRSLARAACRRHPAFLQNTLILGAGDIGQLVARKLINHPEYGMNVVGFVDERPKIRRLDLPDRLCILGGPHRLPEITRELGVERVVICFSEQRASETVELIRRLSGLGVQVDVVPRLFELVSARVGMHAIEGLPIIGLPPCHPSRTALLAKRTIDVVGATLALVATAPVFVFLAWRIRRDSPGPVFFRQTRLGRGMREFTALKFRTMKVDTDTSAHEAYIKQTMSAAAAANASGIYKLDRADAVTATGRWLRRTSLDELPQLINVLRGEMSLVGPRPCISYETEHFKPHQFDRFLVPQGLTGLWQVTARANSTFGEALDMDVAYAHGWSLGLDLRLILRTPSELLRQRRATA
jgi:exopolysaccharide biosynthesis polyprenyl glycosylphosphotransferase